MKLKLKREEARVSQPFEYLLYPPIDRARERVTSLHRSKRFANYLMLLRSGGGTGGVGAAVHEQ